MGRRVADGRAVLMADVPFDVDALRDNARSFSSPPSETAELERQWRALIADQVAAADEIDRLTALLRDVSHD